MKWSGFWNLKVASMEWRVAGCQAPRQGQPHGKVKRQTLIKQSRANNMAATLRQIDISLANAKEQATRWTEKVERLTTMKVELRKEAIKFKLDLGKLGLESP